MKKANSKKAAAHSRNDGTGNPVEKHPSTQSTKEQMIFPGFPPPPETWRGPLVEWLEAHPGWWGREYLQTVTGLDERTLRLQAEHSAGRIIFSSANRGLMATRYATRFEILACVAELRGRMGSHAARIKDTLKAGGVK